MNAEQKEATHGKARVLIVGYGNEMRGDDGLGRVAARHLDRSLAGEAGIDVLDVHQLTPDLAEKLQAYERVIFVDACAGEQAGQFYEQAVVPLERLSQPFSHYVSPGELLAITSALYGARPHAILLGITAGSFDVGKGLSATVRAALPDLLARVRACSGV